MTDAEFRRLIRTLVSLYQISSNTASLLLQRILQTLAECPEATESTEGEDLP